MSEYDEAIQRVGVNESAKEFWGKRDEPFVGRAGRVRKAQPAIEEACQVIPDEAVEAAREAHRAALAAQKAMRTAAWERDAAVQAARAGGASAAELAEALGVNRHRIHAMLKTSHEETK